jgi:prepilin-type N-terminal cleavage/methylation domain-containing protein
MNLRKFQKNESGFTLIELLVVIGILAILLAITLIAINPNKHFQDTRNAKRSSDVSAILDAIYEYESSNNGSQPPSVTGVTTAVALGAFAAQTPTNTTFSTPNLTFTGLSGNIITSGTVTVTGCTNSGNNGTFPVTTGTGTTVVVTNAAGVAGDTTCSLGSWSGRVNICADVVPTYLANLPMDPASTDTACATTYNSGYTIARSNGRFTIAAPNAEGTATISVTR